MNTAVKMYNHHRAEQQVSIPSFVAAMAGAASQVTVVTTDGTHGRMGITVSAFASVSAEPPLLLVCINENSPAVVAIESHNAFCVNVLSESQSHVANCFAGRLGDHRPYDFSCAEWGEAGTGAPVLDGATANFDCRVACSYRAGTHRIFIGRVTAVLSSERASLGFSNRAYQVLKPLIEE